MSKCCVTGFQWQGTPSGKETKLAKNDTYVTGSNKEVAILLIHDVFGWTLNNTRLLADHYAQEVDTTVYVPDFFGGEVVSPDTMSDPKKREAFSVPDFIGRNSKDLRYPEILSAAKALKEDLGFKRIGAIGFCFGGWAVFRLGAKGNNLVDAISTAHPSVLTKEEIDAVGVPVQILAPEHDPAFTPELKAHANSVIPTLGIDYDYQYFPGSTHGFAVKCDESDEKQKKALERAKNAAAGWFSQILHLH